MKQYGKSPPDEGDNEVNLEAPGPLATTGMHSSHSGFYFADVLIARVSGSSNYGMCPARRADPAASAAWAP